MRILVLLCLMGTSHLGFAVTPLSLHAQGNDASVTYLSMIFGVMDGVLHGTGSQIIGKLFGLFSTVLFCFAGVLWTYTTFVAVLNTGAQGQFLGQKWSSMWVPIRVIGGFCLLIPKGSTGYSLIQVIIMSVVLKGVAAANIAWRTTLDYLQEGNTVVESVKQLNKAALPQEDWTDEGWVQNYLLEEAAKALKAEVYMMTIYHTLTQKQYPSTFSALPHFGSTLTTSSPFLMDKQKIIKFPTVWKPGFCGFIHWVPSTLKHQLPYEPQSYDLRQVAVERMLLQLLPTAQRVANKLIASPLQHPNLIFTQAESFALVQATQALVGTLKIESRQNALAAGKRKEELFKKQKIEMESAGWLTAGMYYWVLAKMNKKNIELETDWSDIQRSISVTLEQDAKIKKQLPQAWQKTNFEHFVNEFDNFVRQEKSHLAHYYTAPWMAESMTQHNTEDYTKTGLLDPFQSHSRLFQERMKKMLSQTKDPIIALSTLGKELLEAVERSWKGIQEGAIRFSGPLAEYRVEGEWHANSASLEQITGGLIRFLALLPILTTWMLLNFALGSVLVYYLPCIPFLLFFFGSLTWFSLVIGAIVAAPLVAIGAMSPEGHEVFGQAEQAIRLLASLFLRPLLMVLGLILGMILCTVIFDLFHYGYGIMISGLPEFSGILAGVGQIATTTLYTTVAITTVTRCFALIYELPNRTFSWIGWQTEGHNEAEGLGQVKGGIDQYIGSAGQQVTGEIARRGQTEQTAGTNSAYHATIHPNN